MEAKHEKRNHTDNLTNREKKCQLSHTSKHKVVSGSDLKYVQYKHDHKKEKSEKGHNKGDGTVFFNKHNKQKQKLIHWQHSQSLCLSECQNRYKKKNKPNMLEANCDSGSVVESNLEGGALHNFLIPKSIKIEDLDEINPADQLHSHLDIDDSVVIDSNNGELNSFVMPKKLKTEDDNDIETNEDLLDSYLLFSYKNLLEKKNRKRNVVFIPMPQIIKTETDGSLGVDDCNISKVHDQQCVQKEYVRDYLQLDSCEKNQSNSVAKLNNIDTQDKHQDDSLTLLQEVTVITKKNEAKKMNEIVKDPQLQKAQNRAVRSEKDDGLFSSKSKYLAVESKEKRIMTINQKLNLCKDVAPPVKKCDTKSAADDGNLSITKQENKPNEKCSSKDCSTTGTQRDLKRNAQSPVYAGKNNLGNGSNSASVNASASKKNYENLLHTLKKQIHLVLNDGKKLPVVNTKSLENFLVSPPKSKAKISLSINLMPSSVKRNKASTKRRKAKHLVMEDTTLAETAHSNNQQICFQSLPKQSEQEVGNDFLHTGKLNHNETIQICRVIENEHIENLNSQQTDKSEEKAENNDLIHGEKHNVKVIGDDTLNDMSPVFQSANECNRANEIDNDDSNTGTYLETRSRDEQGNEMVNTDARSKKDMFENSDSVWTKRRETMMLSSLCKIDKSDEVISPLSEQRDILNELNQKINEFNRELPTNLREKENRCNSPVESSLPLSRKRNIPDDVNQEINNETSSLDLSKLECRNSNEVEKSEAIKSILAKTPEFEPLRKRADRNDTANETGDHVTYINPNVSNTSEHRQGNETDKTNVENKKIQQHKKIPGKIILNEESTTPKEMGSCIHEDEGAGTESINKTETKYTISELSLLYDINSSSELISPALFKRKRMASFRGPEVNKEDLSSNCKLRSESSNCTNQNRHNENEFAEDSDVRPAQKGKEGRVRVSEKINDVTISSETTENERKTERLSPMAKIKKRLPKTIWKTENCVEVQETKLLISEKCGDTVTASELREYPSLCNVSSDEEISLALLAQRKLTDDRANIQLSSNSCEEENGNEPDKIGKIESSIVKSIDFVSSEKELEIANVSVKALDVTNMRYVNTSENDEEENETISTELRNKKGRIWKRIIANRKYVIPDDIRTSVTETREDGVSVNKRKVKRVIREEPSICNTNSDYKETTPSSFEQIIPLCNQDEQINLTSNEQLFSSSYELEDKPSYKTHQNREIEKTCAYNTVNKTDNDGTNTRVHLTVRDDKHADEMIDSSFILSQETNISVPDKFVDPTLSNRRKTKYCEDNTSDEHNFVLSKHRRLNRPEMYNCTVKLIRNNKKKLAKSPKYQSVEKVERENENENSVRKKIRSVKLIRKSTKFLFTDSSSDSDEQSRFEIGAMILSSQSKHDANESTETDSVDDVSTSSVESAASWKRNVRKKKFDVHLAYDSNSSGKEETFHNRIDEILQDVLNDSKMTAKNYEFLKYLKIYAPCDIPLAHRVETRMSSAPTREQKQMFKNLGVLLKTGNYTEEEDKMIKANFKRFCKIHNISQDPSPFLNFDYVGERLLNTEERTKFVQFLGKGLDSRMLYSIYKRFVSLYSEKKKGRFSSEEDDIILKYMKGDNQSANKFATLGKILNRDRLAVERRYKNYLVKQKCIRKVLASKNHIPEFVENLMNVLNLTDLNDLKSKTITEEEWAKLSDRMREPIFKLKKSWNITIYPRLFHHNVDDILKKVVHKLRIAGNTDFRELNWHKIASDFENVHFAFLYYIFKRLVKQHVPKGKQSSLASTLKFLENAYNVRNSIMRSLPKIVFENGKVRS